MRYQEFAPSPELAPHIKCYWYLESAATSPQAERIVPDCCTEIVFHFGDPFIQYSEDETPLQQPLSLVVGQMRRCVKIQPTGMVKVLGIRFWPGGSYRVLRNPQHELTDRICSADSVLGRLSEKLSSRIADAGTIEQAIEQIEKELRPLLSRRDSVDQRLSFATRSIVRNGGNISISGLARELGISIRQLDRQFKEQVGASPKMLCRLSRFQRVFSVVEKESSRLSWARIAAACGYFDQAHFIKEFKAFAGTEPTSYFSGHNILSDHFVSESMSFSYNTTTGVSL